MSTNLKSELLEAGYERVSGYADWGDKQIQPLVAEEGDHFIFVNKEGGFEYEARYDE